MQARPDLTQYQGEWYELEYTPFRATEERYSAYQAGDLDALTVSAPALIRAVAQGIPSKAVVTVTRETEGQHTTRGVALDDSGITGPEDLRGKTIGIVDIGTATDYWAKSAVASAGYDFRTDAEYVVLPFPAQEEALRSGQIDVASLPEPFYTIANLNGGVVEAYNSITGPGFDQELILVTFDDSFIRENPEAVCAWIEDFKVATEYYNENTEQARTDVLNAGFVEGSLDVYLASGDAVHPPRGVVDVEGMDRLNESMLEYEILRENQRVDSQELIVEGVTSVE